MARQNKGLSARSILEELEKDIGLPDEDDDDLEDIEVDPEDDEDDGITETETVIYENPVIIFVVFDPHCVKAPQLSQYRYR